MEKAPIIHTQPVEISIRYPGVKLQLIRQQLLRVIRVMLSKAALLAADAAGKKARELTKINSDDIVPIARAAFDAIPWDSLVDDIMSDLTAAVQAGGAGRGSGGSPR